jgi:hypothetical protein
MAAANQVTYVSIPFVRTAEDVLEVSCAISNYVASAKAGFAAL